MIYQSHLATHVLIAGVEFLQIVLNLRYMVSIYFFIIEVYQILHP